MVESIAMQFLLASQDTTHPSDPFGVDSGLGSGSAGSREKGSCLRITLLPQPGESCGT